MTHQKILEKAITEAIEGGWNWNNSELEREFVAVVPYSSTRSPIAIEFKEAGLRDEDGVPAQMVQVLNTYETIFSHAFAKALWGENVYANFRPGVSGDTISFHGLNWQGHLVNMVVAEDPIKYLGDNL